MKQDNVSILLSGKATDNIQCFKKSFTASKAYTYLLRGHVWYSELS
jgi:hypothetical protein